MFEMAQCHKKSLNFLNIIMSWTMYILYKILKSNKLNILVDIIFSLMEVSEMCLSKVNYNCISTITHVNNFCFLPREKQCSH